MERAKFTYDMLSISQQSSCWKDYAKLLLRRLRFGHASEFRGSLSLCVAIPTKSTQQITHRNWHFMSLGQHEFNNFCNLSQIILKIGGFTPLLANYTKKQFFSLKQAFLGESQRPVRQLFNQISSFRLETQFFDLRTTNIYVTL